MIFQARNDLPKGSSHSKQTEPMTKSPCRFCWGICSGECSPEDFNEAKPMPTGASTPRDE